MWHTLLAGLAKVSCEWRAADRPACIAVVLPSVAPPLLYQDGLEVEDTLIHRDKVATRIISVLEEEPTVDLL